MPILTEQWSADYQENLFLDSAEFITKATDHSQFLSGDRKARIVHVPQAGARPTIIADPSVFPLAIGQVDHPDLTYTVRMFASAPALVGRAEENFDSYNKRQALMREHQRGMGEILMRFALQQWAASLGAGNANRNILTTTGTAATTGARPSVLGTAATGNRNLYTANDFSRLNLLLDNRRVPKKGRVLVIPASVYHTEMLALDEFRRADLYGYAYNSQSGAVGTGVIPQAYGFEIVVMPDDLMPYYVGTVANPSLKVPAVLGQQAAAAAATDSFAVLAFHPSFICQADDGINMSVNENAPGYAGGTVLEVQKFFAAAKLRSTEDGIAALVQGA
jgi:hypothetical protein